MVLMLLEEKLQFISFVAGLSITESVFHIFFTNGVVMHFLFQKMIT